MSNYSLTERLAPFSIVAKLFHIIMSDFVSSPTKKGRRSLTLKPVIKSLIFLQQVSAVQVDVFQSVPSLNLSEMFKLQLTTCYAWPEPEYKSLYPSSVAWLYRITSIPTRWNLSTFEVLTSHHRLWVAVGH